MISLIETKRVIIEDGNIVKLDLLYLTLRSLPDSIGNLKSLRGLSLRGTILRSLPETIGNLSSLKWLNLRDNWLNTLPKSIGNLKNLESIDLSGNSYLTMLPKTFSNLKALRFLDVSETPIGCLKDRDETTDFVLEHLKEEGSIELMSKSWTKKVFLIGGSISLCLIILGIILLILTAIFNFKNFALNVWTIIIFVFGFVYLIIFWRFYTRDFPQARLLTLPDGTETSDTYTTVIPRSNNELN